MSKNPKLTGVDRGDIDSKNIIPITHHDRDDLLLLLHHAAQEIPRIRVTNGSVVDRRRIRRRMRGGLRLLLDQAAAADCDQIVLSAEETVRALEFVVLIGMGLLREEEPHLAKIWQRWLDLLSEAVCIPIPAAPLPMLAPCQASTADALTLAAYEAIRRCPPGETCAISYADTVRLEVWLRYLSTRDSRVHAMIDVLAAVTAPMHAVISRLTH